MVMGGAPYRVKDRVASQGAVKGNESAARETNIVQIQQERSAAVISWKKHANMPCRFNQVQTGIPLVRKGRQTLEACKGFCTESDWSIEFYPGDADEGDCYIHKAKADTFDGDQKNGVDCYTQD
eukprot:TRINITY_DN78941_c0_g1_i1.p2 TRINITY_DN78941_c0_g1~~TRINITY_DN78941_c0_g1_i1.p2  ORF type:complete len:132 (+),score=12.49 TRINITY_DN78941_c0_g1_i1:26-397(+)